MNRTYTVLVEVVGPDDTPLDKLDCAMFEDIEARSVRQTLATAIFGQARETPANALDVDILLLRVVDVREGGTLP
jgi:hypothetical protein